jgi:hypothetical protein
VARTNPKVCQRPLPSATPFAVASRFLASSWSERTNMIRHQGAKATGYFRSMLHGPGPAVNKYKKMKQ